MVTSYQARRLRRLQQAGTLGAVVVHRMQGLHALDAQARLQAFDQPHQALAFAGRAREQLAAGRLAGHDGAGGEAQLQRRRRQLHLHQPLAQQHLQVRRVARGFGQRHLQQRLRRHLRIAAPARLVLHRQGEAAHQGMLRGQPGGQARQQHRGGMQHLLGAVGACEQFEAALEARRQRDRHARIGPLAVGTVEIGQQRRAEAPRQPRARQAAQIRQGR
ncbi:MAG: hypothetical protein KIT28_10240, partial [Rubrivivax sp.]|nr:hypothetical protein [Rubrivivax sp.]